MIIITYRRGLVHLLLATLVVCTALVAYAIEFGLGLWLRETAELLGQGFLRQNS